MSKFKISNVLREDIQEFLNSYGGYQKALEALNKAESGEISEEEINSVISLLGTFKLGEVYHLVERFRLEVEEIAPDGAPDTQS
jgi:hypothetical protein